MNSCPTFSLEDKKNRFDIIERINNGKPNNANSLR